MSEATSPKPVSSFDLFSKSWEAVQRNLVVFAILSAPTLIGTVLSLFMSNTNEQSFTKATDFFGNQSGLALAGLAGGAVVLTIVLMVVGVILQALMYIAQLRSAEGKTITLSGIWEEAKGQILKLFGLSIVTGIITAFSFILLIIPGFIMMRRYFLAPYLMVDKKLTIGEAMEQSAAMSKPFSWSIYGIIGVTFLIGLIGIVPVVGGIVSTLVAIAYSVAPALRYLELKKMSA